MFGHYELLLIAFVAVLLFGKQLPSVARNIGEAYKEFRKGFKE